MRRLLAWIAVRAAARSRAGSGWPRRRPAKTVKRAQPPKFSKTDNFYADAFKEGLVGERPGNLSQPAAVATGGNTAAPGSGSTTGSGAGGVAGSGWAALISGPTIEDEIKALKLQVDQNVTTPSDFAGKGYKLARRDFSMLAMLFGIAGEYEGDVRWKNDAPAARDVFARTANNAKVGTQQVWQEAKLRKDELTDLIGGSSPYGGKEAEAKAAWKDVCGRAPLMQHLEDDLGAAAQAALGRQGAVHGQRRQGAARRGDHRGDRRRAGQGRHGGRRLGGIPEVLRRPARRGEGDRRRAANRRTTTQAAAGGRGHRQGLHRVPRELSVVDGPLVSYGPFFDSGDWNLSYGFSYSAMNFVIRSSLPRSVGARLPWRLRSCRSLSERDVFRLFVLALQAFLQQRVSRIWLSRRRAGSSRLR